MSDRFKLCQVYDDQSLRDAMLALEHGAAEIALVVNRQEHLVGTLTDGDIRRAILKGCGLETPLAPYMEKNFTAVSPEASRTEVIELMQARFIRQIPVVTEDKRLVGLHLMHELIGQPVRPNWAVIMAGGLGTRLRPITETLPKPMIRVAGRPILERIILHLVGFGFREIFISVNYLSHIIKDHFGKGEHFGCRITYLDEDEQLGTGGALALLPSRPAHPVLVMNGDLVTQIQADKLLEFHERGGFAATLCIRRYLHRVPFGCLSISEQGRLLGLEEKPLLQRWINAGIYMLSPQAIQLVPKKYFPLTQLFDQLLKDGAAIGGFEIEDDWIDVGQKEQLATARGQM